MAPRARERIVVGVDGSAHGQRALEWAIRQARRVDGHVVAVHAWHWAQTATAEEDERALLDAVVDCVDATGLAEPVERVLRFGATADALVDAAQGAALLVVGTRGRGEIASTLLGSVSHEVARRAPCPVVVIPAARP